MENYISSLLGLTPTDFACLQLHYKEGGFASFFSQLIDREKEEISHLNANDDDFKNRFHAHQRMIEFIEELKETFEGEENV